MATSRGRMAARKRSSRKPPSLPQSPPPPPHQTPTPLAAPLANSLMTALAAVPDLEKPALAGETVLETEKLVKIYGGRAVVNGVDIDCRKGEIVGLLGPNGAGKTTSFYMIVGLVRPNSGRVYFEEKEVTDFPMYKRARMGMGYLPQEESIF